MCLENNYFKEMQIVKEKKSIESWNQRKKEALVKKLQINIKRKSKRRRERKRNELGRVRRHMYNERQMGKQKERSKTEKMFLQLCSDNLLLEYTYWRWVQVCSRKTLMFLVSVKFPLTHWIILTSHILFW